MQTFSNLELTVALTIVTKASGIGAQGQERWRVGFHTRHGCAPHGFRGIPGRDCLEGSLIWATQARQTLLKLWI